MARLRKRVFIPAAAFPTWYSDSGITYAVISDTPIQAQLGNTGLMVAKWIDSNTAICVAFPLPNDADYTGNMGFRVWWLADASGTFVPTVTWAITVATATRGAAFTSYTAIDTPIASDAAEGGTTDNCLSITERGLLTLGGTGLTQALADAGQLLSVQLTPTVFNTLTAFYVYGIEYDYAQVPDASLTRSSYTAPYSKT